MPRVPAWRRYLRLFGSDVNADVNEELRFHVESKTRELIDQGVPPEEARRKAIGHFGDVTEVSALCRRIGQEHSRRIAWKDRLADWTYDTRHALRSLRRSPGFAFIVIGTLAAGMGGATSLFSCVDAWIIRANRFHAPEELVFARSLDIRRGQETNTSYADYADLASRARQFQHLSAWTQDFFTLSIEREPERVLGSRVTPNFFATLAVRPMLGRSFLVREGEFGNHRVAIVSQGFWKARLNGERSVIGSHLNLNGEPHVIVGVLPEGFHLTLSGRSNIFTPLALPPEDRARRESRYLRLIGRMRPGVTVAQARQELGRIAAELASAYPNTNREVGAFILSLSGEIGRHVGDEIVLILFAITLGLLLIACSNVANLLLVRALGLQRAAAIQLSLGAGRGRLIRQALIETLILFLVAAAVGAAGGSGLNGLITSYIPFENRGYLPDYGEAPFRWAVFAFAFAITLVSALAFGLAPALESSAANVASVLKSSGAAVSPGRKVKRLRMTLVVAQVVLATVLLSSTAVLVQAFASTWMAPIGCDSHGVLTFKLSLNERAYPDATRRRLFFESVAESVGTAAIARSVPFGNDFGLTNFRLTSLDPTARPPLARFNAVSPNYFAVLKTPLLTGRLFTPGDAQDGHLTAIVNDFLVSQYLGGVNPIGQTIKLGRLRDRPVEIVGVVAHVQESNDVTRRQPQIYVPFAQAPAGDAFLLMRTSGDPMTLMPGIRKRIAGLDASLPVYDIRTLDERLQEAFAPFRIASGMLVWFGFLALTLAAMGVYGVVAFSVSQRTHEIGIRAALGANRARLQLLFLRQGLWILAAGLFPGLGLGLAAAFALRSLIQGISQSMLTTGLVVTATLLALVTLVAILIPARRAASVDPLEAVRCD